MKYSLRSLMVVVAIVPPLLSGAVLLYGTPMAPTAVIWALAFIVILLIGYPLEDTR